MTGFALNAYRKVEVETGVTAADPHQLILMLYDGALAAIKQAAVHMAAGRVAEKGKALTQALRLVDEGLKGGVDRKAGGALAFRLLDLYDYMTMRLLQANLRNDRNALDEVARLLADLREAWAQIRPQGAAPRPPESAPAPMRRLAVHA